MNILEVHGLDAGYGSLQVLWRVDIELGRGEIGVVLGPNGAGKSTLLSAIAGDIRSDSGTVSVDGRDLTRKSSTKRLRHGLAWAPEGRNVFAHLTVRDNLRMSAQLAGVGKDFTGLQEQVLDLFPAMAEKANALAGTLSGGQQQILAISRILIRRPLVALLDEPTIGLAPSIVEKLGTAIAITRDMGVSWLIAEQNLGWLSSITQRTYVLQGGRVVRTGGSEIISSREQIRDAFFGSNEAHIV